MSTRLRHACLVCALLTLAPPSARAAFPIDPNTPNPLPAATFSDAGCADGAGGVFVLTRGVSVNAQVRLYRYGPNGLSASGWSASGLALADTTGTRGDAVVIPDGSGGAYVAWDDARNPATQQDIFLQRVTAAGAIAPGWPARGLLVSSAANAESSPRLVGDGAGGVLVAFTYNYAAPDYDIYAARVSGAGSVLWLKGIETDGNYQTGPFPVLDHTDNLLGIAYQYQSNALGAKLDIKMTFANLTDGTVSYRRDICTAAGDQYLYGVAAGSGDLYYVYWRDGRTANYSVYAACLQRTSQMFSGIWPIGDGLPVADGGGYQFGVVGAVDAQNDLWVAIDDGRYGTIDIIAQRLTTGGYAAPGWPAAGEAVCSAASDQFPVGIDIDGAQDAVILWTDRRNGVPTENDMYGTRVQPDGSIAPGFPYNGQALATETGAQQSPGFVVGDPAGGAYVAWTDGGYAILQHLDRFGALGDVAPHLTATRDVPGDQGGFVRLQWNASPYDVDPIASVASYWVWRATPLAAAQAAVSRGARWASARADDAPPPAGGRLFMADPAGAASFAWEYLASQPASLLPAYSYVAATTTDSVAGHNPYTAFMVQARSNWSGVFWSSPADSGYSVDNLAPGAPSPFTGTYGGGTSSLVWGAPAAPDLAGYRLYRGTSAGFVPGPALLVGSPTGTAYTDAAGAPYWYKVAAVDVHGDVGPYAVTLPAGALAVEGDAPPAALALALAGANPTRGPSCTLRLALPHPAHVRLSILDVSGRRVRTLLDGELAAGVHPVTWDGRDDRGAPSPTGLYLARLEADGRTLVQRVARLQ